MTTSTSGGVSYVSQFTPAQVAQILAVINGNTINASVQPRSGTFSSLKNAAGLAGEWSYPTDRPEVAFRHTSAANGAHQFRSNRLMGAYFDGFNWFDNDNNGLVSCPAISGDTLTYDFGLHGSDIFWNNPGQGGIATFNLVSPPIVDGTNSGLYAPTFITIYGNGNSSKFRCSYSGNSQVGPMINLGPTATTIACVYLADDDIYSFSVVAGLVPSTVVVPANGGTTDCITTSTTIAVCNNMSLQPAGIIATHTLKLPDAVAYSKMFSGRPFYISNTSLNAITALTVSANSSNTIKGVSVTTLPAGTTIGYSPIVDPGVADAAAFWVRVL